MLKRGDKFLIDFDGVIVDYARPDGTLWYPQIGPIKSGIRLFLGACEDNGILPIIWSSRCNELLQGMNSKEFPIFGIKAIEQISEFMLENDLYYGGFYPKHKPIHTPEYKILIDDRCLNPVHTLITRALDTSYVY